MDHTTKNSGGLYQAVTDKIVAAIEGGASTFQLPWHKGGVTQARPANAYTKEPYHGVNVIALWVAALNAGYPSGFWATYRQWQKLGAQVRRGECASTVVFYKLVESEVDVEDSIEFEIKTYRVTSAARVFNAEQVDGWEPPASPTGGTVDTLAAAQAFVERTGADIRHGGDRAYYNSAADRIQLPDRERFTDTEQSTATEAYYATLFHELTHWSGAPTRLARDLSGRFGDEAYAMEELVAELGAAFLCADRGVTNSPRGDHAAYIATWLEVLKRDAKAIFTAAGKASRAVEYLADLAAHADHAETPSAAVAGRQTP